MDNPKKILAESVKEVLSNIPLKPFFCLPLSAGLYMILKDREGFDVRIVTGNLFYKNEILFKQDFSIESVTNEQYTDWEGHAWVEWEELIIDLSIVRTVYSDQFTKACKTQIIKTFGDGRGCIIANRQQFSEMGFTYVSIDVLRDETATGILSGMDELLRS